MQYKCKRCGHKWFGRTNKKPISCPNCQSKYWDSNKPAHLGRKRSK